MDKYSLAHLSEGALLHGLKSHLARERDSLALVLAHLAERFPQAPTPTLIEPVAEQGSLVAPVPSVGAGEVREVAAQPLQGIRPAHPERGEASGVGTRRGPVHVRG